MVVQLSSSPTLDACVYRKSACVRLLRSGIVAVIATFGAQQQVNAAELSWEVGSDVRYSNNIDLLPENGRDEVMLIPRAGLSFETEGKYFDADLDTLIDYYDYTKDTYSSETTYYADLVLDIHLVPGLFDWLVEDSLANEAVVIEEVERPNNRQNVNVFFTGPSLMFRLGQSNELNLLGGYIRTDASENPNFDSNRWVGKASFIRSISSRTDLGLNAEYEDANFDVDQLADGQSNDYERRDAYVSAVWQRGPNSLLMDLGYTDLDYVDRRDDDGERIRVVYTRVTGDAGALELTYQNLFTDASRTIDGAPSYGLGRVDVSADVYRLKDINLGYIGNFYGYAVEYLVGYREERYVQFDAQDRNVTETSLEFVRPVARRLSWTGGLSWGDYDYINPFLTPTGNQSRNDKETYIVSGFLFQLRPNLELNTEIGWHDIQSDTPEDEADEWLAQVGFTYRN